MKQTDAVPKEWHVLCKELGGAQRETVAAFREVFANPVVGAMARIIDAKKKEQAVKAKMKRYLDRHFGTRRT